MLSFGGFLQTLPGWAQYGPVYDSPQSWSSGSTTRGKSFYPPAGDAWVGWHCRMGMGSRRHCTVGWDVVYSSSSTTELRHQGAFRPG
uniref:Secreted protein n=1 Tax=Knipowitschia caucasica TaxID=637954 RepID=A0AAV2M2T1_KNICA